MRRKSLLALVLAAALLTASVSPAFAAEFFAVSDFGDYMYGDFTWAKNELMLAVAAEFFKGYPPEQKEMPFHFRGTGEVTCKVLGELRPRASITRAEFATIVVNALDLGTLSYSKSPFADVKPSNWFGPNVLRLVAKGIIDPADYGAKFKPNGPITREEIAVWMVRAAEAAGIKAKPAKVRFKDFDPRSRHAAEIGKAVALGFLKGYPDGTFRSGNAANRAEAAVLLFKLLKKLPLFGGINGEKAKQMAVETAKALTEAQEMWPVDLNNTGSNPAFEAALQHYQSKVKDVVTEYNLYPWMHPEGLYLLYGLASADILGPWCDWPAGMPGYGLATGILMRGYPDWAMPAVYVGKVHEVGETVAFIGRGPIAEVSFNGVCSTKYVNGREFYGEAKAGGYRALFVKQNGQWKVAALWRDSRGPWLGTIGFAKSG